jgi:hypothetical protein
VYTMANQELAVVVATIINIYSALAGWLAATRMTSTCIHAPDGRPAWHICTRPNQPTNKQTKNTAPSVCALSTRGQLLLPGMPALHCIGWWPYVKMVAYSTYIHEVNRIGPWRIATQLALSTIYTHTYTLPYIYHDIHTKQQRFSVLIFPRSSVGWWTVVEWRRRQCGMRFSLVSHNESELGM